MTCGRAEAGPPPSSTRRGWAGVIGVRPDGKDHSSLNAATAHYHAVPQGLSNTTFMASCRIPWYAVVGHGMEPLWNPKRTKAMATVSYSGVVQVRRVYPFGILLSRWTQVSNLRPPGTRRECSAPTPGRGRLIGIASRSCARPRRESRGG